MIPILYGSQTGTGIHLARLLQQRLQCRSFILPIDSFNPMKFNEFRFVIFICSTHGDGQPPFNMSKFFNLILKDLPSVFNFEYAVLGLGDSSYDKYNYCSKILYNRLEQLGAVPHFKEFSNTQDSRGPYDGFYRFCDRIEAVLSNIKKFDEKNRNFKFYPENESDVSNEAFEDEICEFSFVNKASELNDNKTTNFLVKNDIIICGQEYRARIVSNNLMTPESYDKKVYELVLEIDDHNTFYPGDCICITPKNTEEFLDKLNFKPEEIDFIRDKIDLRSCPQQTHFKKLVEYSDKEEFKNKMLEISEDYDLYHSYIIVPRRHIFEVIHDFKLEIPFEFFAEYNRIYPRYYSFTKIGKECKILYNEVLFKTMLLEPRKGLCSEYLKTLSGEISVSIVESKLFMEDKNLLFFATGTGLTLPRSALHFFNNKNIKIFYGFRYYGIDQLCKDEFKDADIYYASSRDDGKYIMDCYKSNKVDDIDEWLVFASGNARINKEIRKTLKEVHGKEVIFQSETW